MVEGFHKQTKYFLPGHLISIKQTKPLQEPTTLYSVFNLEPKSKSSTIVNNDLSLTKEKDLR